MRPRPPLVSRLAYRAGITGKQLEYWCTMGFVKSVTTGKGHDRQIEPAEARVVIVMGTLTRAGITARLAAQIARKACDLAEPGKGARVRISRRGDPDVIIEIRQT